MSSPSAVPLVTIGVPVRNGAAFLSEALASALAQDYTNLEILISDNASTDETETISRACAGRDPRVRYWRNPVDLGAAGNFGKVLSEARGSYFTWLAHDDLLSHPDYVRRTVAYLEEHPDVGLCASAFAMLGIAGPDRVAVWSFPEIAPDREPSAVREVFFSWPQERACFAIYGMGRHAALAAASFDGRRYRGRFAVTHMEYPILLAVLRQWRIVALPDVLRTYRRNPGSAYHTETDRMAGFDFMLLGWQTKAMLLREALRFRLPAVEKRRLIGRALRNLLPRTVRTTRGEARRLRVAAEERRRLILELRRIVEERRDVLARYDPLRAASVDPGSPLADDLFAPDPAPLQRSHFPAWAGPLVDVVEALVNDFFVRPTPRRQAERRADMLDSLRLRTLCEDRLAEIDRLTAEAERCLMMMRDAAHAAVTTDARD